MMTNTHRCLACLILDAGAAFVTVTVFDSGSASEVESDSVSESDMVIEAGNFVEAGSLVEADTLVEAGKLVIIEAGQDPDAEEPGTGCNC